MPSSVLQDEKARSAKKNDEPPDEEKKLLAKAKHGDAEAFGKLVESYQRRVYTVIYRFVRNHNDADDLAQESFIRAYKAIDRFDLRYPFGPWMYRIAINLTLNYLKKRKLKIVDSDLARQSSGKNPASKWKQDETRHRVHKAIAGLPIKLRHVLVLRVYENWPYAQIAEVLELPIGTVMSRLSRAREVLKEELGELL
ncbi:sigma-70 family RNA polymerase sigma factor [candidate division WOR-3 bacterium]|uniref:Sigma-70 family RNA polymerase sigma factor n=1 Tax=candidate division WOR-3 bacterium TaxID=2052148 RepID=A0A9D5KA24_UNCW3|nr:sigma-70 family RNA polymerase sigma factor [candidate division WOR-3 bacterium]MBD3364041.1 sigma-70 family RNA polymerase sigma factor [candidate division WOR-3 bacterium]